MATHFGIVHRADDTLEGTTVLTRQVSPDKDSDVTFTHQVRFNWAGVTLLALCKLAADSLWIKVQTKIRKDWGVYKDGEEIKIDVVDLITGRDTGPQMKPAQAFGILIEQATTYEDVVRVCEDAGMSDEVIEIMWKQKAEALGLSEEEADAGEEQVA